MVRSSFICASVVAALLVMAAAGPDPQDVRLTRDSARAGALVRDAAAGALAGHPGDELFIGGAYEWGTGLPQDYGAASQWYGRSASHGVAAGMVDLGILLENGAGVAADPARAMTLYKAAAAAGSAAGQIRLGMAFQWGHGVPGDQCRAAGYYDQAARQGEAIAQLYGLLLQAGAPATDCDIRAPGSNGIEH